MLVFKFKKSGNYRFLSHLDVLKSITRTIRRAEIPVNYSEGFNPHMLINLSNPIPLGIDSMCEYCFVNTQLKARDFQKKYENKQHPDIAIIDCKNVDKNPNIAGKSHSVRYSISFKGLIENKSKIKEMLDSDTYIIEYLDKKGQVTKDVKPLIYSYKFSGDKLIVRLGFGNNNLRIDRFANSLISKLDLIYDDIELIKLKGFVMEDDKLIEIDKFI